VAQQVSVKLVDDLDGSEAVDTVAFSIDGRQYEMDLSDKNAAKLRDALAPFVASARQIGGGRRRRTSPKTAPGGKARQMTDRERTIAIREWARQQGHQVADRGRIPSSIVEAYEKAH
jgi:Lsr2